MSSPWDVVEFIGWMVGVIAFALWIAMMEDGDE